MKLCICTGKENIPFYINRNRLTVTMFMKKWERYYKEREWEN